MEERSFRAYAQNYWSGLIGLLFFGSLTLACVYVFLIADEDLFKNSAPILDFVIKILIISLYFAFDALCFIVFRRGTSMFVVDSQGIRLEYDKTELKRIEWANVAERGTFDLRSIFSANGYRDYIMSCGQAQYLSTREIPPADKCEFLHIGAVAARLYDPCINELSTLRPRFHTELHYALIYILLPAAQKVKSADSALSLLVHDEKIAPRLAELKERLSSPHWNNTQFRRLQKELFFALRSVEPLQSLTFFYPSTALKREFDRFAPPASPKLQSFYSRFDDPKELKLRFHRPITYFPSSFPSLADSFIPEEASAAARERYRARLKRVKRRHRGYPALRLIIFAALSVWFFLLIKNSLLRRGLEPWRFYTVLTVIALSLPLPLASPLFIVYRLKSDAIEARTLLFGLKLGSWQYDELREYGTLRRVFGSYLYFSKRRLSERERSAFRRNLFFYSGDIGAVRFSKPLKDMLSMLDYAVEGASEARAND